LSINFFNEDVSFHLKRKRVLKSWIIQICLKEKKVIGNVNFIFTSKNKILEINKQFLKHDYFTDIITFNSNFENTLSGDIFISIDTVIENAAIFESKFIDELYRVMIHGILHLLGYDDKTGKQKKIMRKMENFSLEILYDLFNLK
jgi:probable rRNA maturation factor